MTAVKEKKQQINVSQVIEERTSKRFAFNLIILTFLLMILEGFDVSSLSYVAPVLIDQWKISPSTFGIVFGVSTFGLMLGGFLFGYLGDRIGRKNALLLSIITISIFSLSTIFANTISSLMILRFFVGLGLGGTVPLSIVLVNEYAPKKAKGRWVSIMFTGFPLGMSIGGILGAWLLTNFSWHSVFIVGGVGPLLLLAILYYKLPESISFLVMKNKSRTQIAKLVTLLKPELQVSQDAHFIVNKVDQAVKFTPKLLFSNHLRIVTPLIWFVSIISSFVVYFLNSWMPKLLTTSGLSLEEASLTTSTFHIAGLLGGPVVGWLIDRYGIVVCSIFPIMGCFIMALLGTSVDGILLTLLVFSAGFFVVGTQSILTISTPMFYPTAFRAKGNGFAMGIAKIGSIFGPIIGGILIAQLTLSQLFKFNSGVIAFSFILFLVLGLLSRKVFNIQNQVTTMIKHDITQIDEVKN